MNSYDSQKSIATQLLIEKSERNMEQALRNAEFGYWDLVANRLYYSIFHAVTAMLLIDGIKTSTHKATSMQFGKSYVFDRCLQSSRWNTIQSTSNNERTGRLSKRI